MQGESKFKLALEIAELAKIFQYTLMDVRESPRKWEYPAVWNRHIPQDLFNTQRNLFLAEFKLRYDGRIKPLVVQLTQLRGKAAVRLGEDVDRAIEALLLKGPQFENLLVDWLHLQDQRGPNASVSVTENDRTKMLDSILVAPTIVPDDKIEQLYIATRRENDDEFYELLDQSYRNLKHLLDPFLAERSH